MLDLLCGLFEGITPAWAGKSRISGIRWERVRDYPRVGGEEIIN